MVNVLLIEDNLYYCKSFINFIFKKVDNARLYKILTNGTEAIKTLIMDKDKIDIVILDLNIPQFNGVQILEEIERYNLVKYKGSVVVISGEISLISKVMHNTFLYTYINKICGFERIEKEITQLIEIKDQEKNTLENRIFKELQSLNYNFSYLGTQYIGDAIKLVYEYDNIENIKIEKNIYKKLAQKYKKTLNTIKTNIINATDLMYYDCDCTTLSKYFNIYHSEKPTPKVVITTIVKKLKYNC